MKTKKQFLWMLFAILVCGFTAVTMASCGGGDDDDDITGGGSGGSSNPEMLKTPLTLEAIEAGTITFKNNATGPVTYRVNDGAAQTIESQTAGEISVVAGDKVTFFGDNSSYSPSVFSNIKCSAFFYVYGNIMSLITSSGYATADKLEGNFNSLFRYNTKLKNHPSHQLVLPATTLAGGCYCAMFNGCTGLTEAPELPATTLASSCYAAMFFGCKGLTEAPKLPATTLAEDCYSNMFGNCTGLTEAPELPATTLARECYHAMFSGCTNLTSVTCLATDISAKYATSGWLRGVSSTGTFTKVKGAQWSRGESGIPEGWTVVEQ